MDIVKKIKKDIINLSEEYKNNSIDNYDFWNEHIKYVYEESINLASKYDADIEIVSLGALLHDIALVKKVGTRKEHHINGKMLCKEILEKYNYSKNKIDKVLGCVYNHRSSKNATNIEELCVSDADILAHFDNIPMIFNMVISKNNFNLGELRKSVKESFEKDYNDLSEKTKKIFKEKYDTICKIVLGE